MAPKADRRQQLVACARWVFARKGYHAASVDDVIQRAGVARGTFYNYFESKRAIFQEILEDHFRRIWESVAPIRVGPGEDIRAQVFTNFRSLLALFEKDKDLGRLMLAVAVGLDPESDRALAKFYRSSRDRLARALTIGQELGFVRRVDAEVLAISIMGTIKEYLSQQILGMKPPDLASFLKEIQGFFEVGLLQEHEGVPATAEKRRGRRSGR